METTLADLRWESGRRFLYPTLGRDSIFSRRILIHDRSNLWHQVSSAGPGVATFFKDNELQQWNYCVSALMDDIERSWQSDCMSRDRVLVPADSLSVDISDAVNLRRNWIGRPVREWPWCYRRIDHELTSTIQSESFNKRRAGESGAALTTCVRPNQPTVFGNCIKFQKCNFTRSWRVCRSRNSADRFNGLNESRWNVEIWHWPTGWWAAFLLMMMHACE